MFLFCNITGGFYGLAAVDGGVFGFLAVGCGGGEDVSLQSLRQVINIANAGCAGNEIPRKQLTRWLASKCINMKVCLPGAAAITERFKEAGSSVPKSACHLTLPLDAAVEMVEHFVVSPGHLAAAMRVCFKHVGLAGDAVGARAVAFLPNDARRVVTAMPSGCLPMSDFVPEFVRGADVANDMPRYGLSSLVSRQLLPLSMRQQVPLFQAEVQQYSDHLGVPINLSRDGVALADGTISQVCLPKHKIKYVICFR